LLFSYYYAAVTFEKYEKMSIFEKLTCSAEFYTPAAEIFARACRKHFRGVGNTAPEELLKIY
jgi:hypothetical protein